MKLKLLSIFTIITVISSCISFKRIAKKNNICIKNKIDLICENNSYKSQGKINYRPNSLLNIFEINNLTSQKVRIYIDSNNYINLIPIDSLNKNVSIFKFKGEYIKNRYFEVYIRNKKNCIPILYKQNDLKRIRISLTIDSNLIIEDMYDFGGHIFIFGGAGGKNKNIFYYKKLAI